MLKPSFILDGAGMVSDRNDLGGKSYPNEVKRGRELFCDGKRWVFVDNFDGVRDCEAAIWSVKRCSELSSRSFLSLWELLLVTTVMGIVTRNISE
jgi:hypothetical protein